MSSPRGEEVGYGLGVGVAVLAPLKSGRGLDGVLSGGGDGDFGGVGGGRGGVLPGLAGGREVPGGVLDFGTGGGGSSNVGW